MKIEIIKQGERNPLEIWDDYPVVPNVGDRISVNCGIFTKIVKYRVFRKDRVSLLVKD